MIHEPLSETVNDRTYEDAKDEEKMRRWTCSGSSWSTLTPGVKVWEMITIIHGDSTGNNNLNVSR